MQWSAALLDAHIAPGFSSLTQVTIPHLASNYPEAPHWLANHFLNTVLRASFSDGQRQASVGYIRRVQGAMTSYEAARQATLKHLESRAPFTPGLRTYYTAISLWESTFLDLSIAIDTLRFFGGGALLFQKNDGTALQRIYTIANQVKHVGSCISSGQCTAADTIPLWLAAEAVHSFGVAVQYSELASVIDEFAELADMMQDPPTFAEKLKASITKLES